MANTIGLAGGTPQKQVRFAPIYTGRWSSGIWTNRSPLRDANTSRIVEKFYGAAGDALIAGLNTEISNRLTLTRRPGTSAYDVNSYSDVERFYEFRIFNTTNEQIDVMVDQANALYSTFNGAKNLVFTKSSGAGQSYMQSVGNILYWGDGVDNKKWLQTLFEWTANTQWNTATTPVFTTFLIDPNGNIQQLIPASIPITGISISSNVLTVTSSETLTSFLATGMNVTFPENMNATFLENQVVTVTGVSGSTFTASYVNANYSSTESGVSAVQTSGGSVNPTSAGTQPTWSTVVPASGNNFQGGTTQDGQVFWVNRGNPVENWGIVPEPTTAPSFIVGSSNVSWQANTFYSLVSVVVDSNGNLQQVTTAGKSSGTQPTWATIVGHTTTDGTATWTMIQTAASMVWQPNTAYTQSIIFNLTSVANASAGSTVYSGAITGGAANAYAGKTFVVTGWTNIVNNGSFTCSASSATTITLDNANGVSETNAATATLQGSFVIGNAQGTNCLFMLAPSTQPTLTGNVSAYLYSAPHSGPVGQFILTNPTSTGSALASDTSLNSLWFTGTPLSSGAALAWNTVNAAGASTGTTNPFPSYTQNYQLIILATLNVPVAGTYQFTIKHHDGTIWGIGNGATCSSGTSDNPIGQTLTAAQGYPIFGGTNIGLEGGAVSTDTFTVTFPTAGQYPVEVDYAYWYHSGQQLNVQCNGFNLANTSGGSGAPTSGANQPSWPAWSTTYAPNYPTVTESNGQLTWENIGPVTDFAWSANTNFTLPNTTIIDPNGYEEAPYRTGVSGTTAPTFATGANQLTYDNPNLIWINKGIAAIPKTGTISTFEGGWKYCVALVNTLDNTVSNCGLLTNATGNFIGVNGVTITAGSGLPTPANIDPQSDYVAIFRTTDGGATPFLIPGQITTWTIPLSTYLTDGYVDITPDTGLNNLIEAPIEGENTPPLAGAKNLTYHLNRIWYSVGNVLYYTSGPDTPAGNGLNGTAPDNFDSMPSLITRIVPTTAGVLVFTVSDVYIVQGNGTSNSPIQSAVPLLPGIGLLSYNALDLNGPTIGLFTTDNNFLILDPSAGVTYAGLPINDQLRLNNGKPGQSWNPANVFVAWHVQGEDQAWYLCDGTNGWFRLMSTPAPETGYTWSPFAVITGGAGAVQSVEISPGVHRLLIGPTSTGSVLYRDLTSWSDNGTAYAANATIGSAVLAQPGQVATVAYIVTDSVRVGTPLDIGLLVDEALPYYTGPIDILKDRSNDPPNLPASRSFYSERFYLSEIEDMTAAMRHCQIQIIWSSTDTVQNELLTLTVFGAFQQEQ